MVLTRFWVVLAHVVLAKTIPLGYKHETHLVEVATYSFYGCFTYSLESAHRNVILSTCEWPLYESWNVHFK